MAESGCSKNRKSEISHALMPLKTVGIKLDVTTLSLISFSVAKIGLVSSGIHELTQIVLGLP